MTVTTTASQVLALGDGSTTAFDYNFLVPGSTSTDQTNFQVTYADVDGNVTVLNTSQYSVTGVNNSSGGTVVFQVNSAPIPIGSTLLIQRVVPYTQPDSISNQGNFYPQAVEDALDNLELQIQQILTQHAVLPIGGTANSILRKTTSTDYDATWYPEVYEMKFGNIVGTTLSNSQVVGYWNVTKNCTIPADFGSVNLPTTASSKASAIANATATASFSFDKRSAVPNTWTTEGTITFASGSVTASFTTTGSTSVSLLAGDFVRVVGPASADATLSSPTFNIVATTP